MRSHRHSMRLILNMNRRFIDNIMTFKLTVKTIAKRHGMWATFMPKPKFGENGSGMHINLSLVKEGKNIFYDPDAENRLSTEALYFIGGLMKHIKAITAKFLQTTGAGI